MQILQENTGYNYLPIEAVAHGFTDGQFIYQDGTGTWQLAVADDETTLSLGMVWNAQTDYFDLITYGLVEWIGHGFTTAQYLSAVTAGDTEDKEPTIDTHYQQKVFEIPNANWIKVIDQGFIEVIDTKGAERVHLTGEVLDAVVTLWDQVYKDAAGTWQQALADDETTLKQGMVVAIDNSGTTPLGTIVTYGTVRRPLHGWTVGATYYLSATTAGAVSILPPSLIGEYIEIAFEVIDGDVIKVLDQNDEAVGAGLAVPPYTTGANYAVNDLFYYQGGTYAVTIAITNAPATPPWTSLENINHQVVATQDSGAISNGDILFDEGNDGKITSHNPYIAPTSSYHLAPKKYVDDINSGIDPPPSLTMTATETRTTVVNGLYPMFRFDHVSGNGKTGMVIVDIGWNDPATNKAQSVRYRITGVFTAYLSSSYQLVNHLRSGDMLADQLRASWNGGRLQIFYRAKVAVTGMKIVYSAVSLDGSTVTNRLGSTDAVVGSGYGETTLPTSN